MKTPAPSCSTTFLIAGDYCTRNAYGHIFCDYLSSGSGNHSVPVSNIADANSNPLHDSNLWIHLRPHLHGNWNLSLTRNFIHLLPYPRSRTPLISDQIFGITIICLLAVQLGLGFYHHRRYIKDSPTYRRWFTYVHLWLGRLIILLGLANAGCGLKLAFVQSKYVIAWWATCGFLAIVYALVSLFAWWTRDGKLDASGRSSPGEVPRAGNYNFQNPRQSKVE